MTDLPLEILRLTAQKLECKQLTHFQLVNKRWHEASSEYLYSSVLLYSDRIAKLYFRTLTSSPRFGSYLKRIYLCDLFSKDENTLIWDRFNILDTLIKYCINLRSLSVSFPHHILWTRLIHAANQGQLPNLQNLPYCEDETLELYVCTALAFKKSLTHLDLVDHSIFNTSRQPLNTWAFQELQGRIKEFLNLKSLAIKHCNSQPFSYIVDPLIDYCPHLLDLHVTLFPKGLQAPARQDSLAIPKPNIRTLHCDWTTIYKDDQLKYVMRKFPNLRFLNVRYDDEFDSFDWKQKPNETSYEVMMEFMNYVSNIKEIVLSFSCKRRDIANYWSEFSKFRKLEKLSIHYQVYEDSSIASMSYNDKEEQSVLTYNINSGDDSMPHEEFLNENGGSIKQLSINYTSSANNKLDKGSYLWYTFKNENWIFQVLQLCPFLQELKLLELVELNLPGNSTYQHTELKKLVIEDQQEITYLGFLKNLSFHVPNLKELEISEVSLETEDKNGYCVRIDMPYSMLDRITIDFEREADRVEDYFIKLNTIVDEKYYFNTLTEKREITYNAYKKAKKRCLFEITCRGLKQFEVKRYNSSCGIHFRSIKIF